jgi:photosystem II stability/assembly factor-like uncharacterized protein
MLRSSIVRSLIGIGLCATLLSAEACAQTSRPDAGGASPAPAVASGGEQTAAKTGAEPNDPGRVLTETDLRSLSWRSVGPANMGGRVAAVAFAPGSSKQWFVGFATGGLWKTTNAGTTYSPVFDKEATSSIGSIAIADAPADWPGWAHEKEPVPQSERAEKGSAKIIWVGTGEGNGRNSSSWGAGVYRSTDGGGKFQPVGLEDSHDIPSLVVDPRDPDVCFVAALGHLWGANETRGVYKTSDGGKSWTPSLRIDANTGACAVALSPAQPDTVFAAMYARRRSISSYQSGGPEGGVYRSRDAGRTWEKLTNGLPAQTGRIGLAVHPQKPNVVMAAIESDEGGKVAEAFNDRSRLGGVFRSENGGDSWQRLTDFNPRAFYFSRIEMDPANDQRVYMLGWHLYISDDGGKTFRSGTAKVAHVDFHAIAISPTDPDQILVGNDGGIYLSYDGAKTWDFHNHLAVGQFYNVEVDDSDPYRIAGGLQDNGSWFGPSDSRQYDDGKFMGREGGITNQHWNFFMGGDGFHVDFDPSDPNIVYAEWQGGNLYRIRLDSKEMRYLKPAAKEGEPRRRFNWNAPFFVSSHDPSVVYLAGNIVYRLNDRGERWTAISPDLSRLARDNPIAVTTEGSDAETAATVVSLAESPMRAGVLWAGTDDGLIHVTQDGGAEWRNVTPPEARGLYISKIEASRHVEGRAYAAIDGHRSDVFDPIVLVTSDFGASWTFIAEDLPTGAPVKTVREDPENPNVLYAGTERALFVSIDGGANWVKLNGDSLPTVAIDDLKIQSREHDLVAGTHGRSIWILDDASALSQLTPEIVASPFHAFAPLPGRPYYIGPHGGLWSDQMFIAPNPERGTYISFWLRDYTPEGVKITIKDANDFTVRELKAPGVPGLSRVMWDLMRDESQRLANADGLPEFVQPGHYSVTISAGDDQSADVNVEVLPVARAAP